ncbi:MAG: helix-turn-helix domain-containing protein [candidate division WOR-3 bacterium]
MRRTSPLLVDEYVTQFNRLQSKSVSGIRSDALALLMAHGWPGNMRELQNVIERAFVLCRTGQIRVLFLPAELTAGSSAKFSGSTRHAAHEALDIHLIRIALERNRYGRTAVARELGVHKTTLLRRIRRLGIELPRSDGRYRHATKRSIGAPAWCYATALLPLHCQALAGNSFRIILRFHSLQSLTMVERSMV